MHPPFRRKKFRSAPSPPGGEACARSIPSSSPHKIYDFAGAPLLRKERMRRARRKRENGGAQVMLSPGTHVSSPRRGASGGFWWSSNRLPPLFAAATLALAGLVGLSPSIGRTSRRGRRPRRPVLSGPALLPVNLCRRRVLSRPATWDQPFRRLILHCGARTPVRAIPPGLPCPGERNPLPCAPHCPLSIINCPFTTTASPNRIPIYTAHETPVDFPPALCYNRL